MASDNAPRGKKRSKAFYRKSSYGGKRQCTGKNYLQPGLRGFLVMCHGNESGAVKESYNILNEYGDLLYGQEKHSSKDAADGQNTDSGSEGEDECDDIEKALQKEVDSLKNIAPTEKRFQNVATKTKNCVFIRTVLEDPVKVVTKVMEDIAEKNLNKARHAARMLPIVGTCKAQTAAIAELAKNTLAPYFSKESTTYAPSSFTIIFKARNNNGTTCGKNSVIPAVKDEIMAINPDLNFSWSEFDVAVLVEVVCTICCLGVAPGFDRLRKYNFQELAQGPKLKVHHQEVDSMAPGEVTTAQGTTENKCANGDAVLDSTGTSAPDGSECVGTETPDPSTKPDSVPAGNIPEVTEAAEEENKCPDETEPPEALSSTIGESIESETKGSEISAETEEPTAPVQSSQSCTPPESENDVTVGKNEEETVIVNKNENVTETQ